MLGTTGTVWHYHYHYQYHRPLQLTDLRPLITKSDPREVGGWRSVNDE